MTEFQRDSNTLYLLTGDYTVQAVIDNLSGDSLLDIGCGDGILTRKLCGHFLRVVGVDCDAENLRRARGMGAANAEFIYAAVESLETDERFDVITMLMVLEHVADPVLVLERLSRFLNDTGMMFVCVPNAEAINRRIGMEMGVVKNLHELSEYDFSIGHRRYYDMDTLRHDIDDAGLDVVKTGGIMFKTLSSPQMEWFLNNGKWGSGEFGWGDKDAFIRALYETGKQYPDDCNIIYAIARKG